MRDNYSLSIPNNKWMVLLRVLSLITLFVGAYSMVRAVMVLIADYRGQDVSMLVVVIYLLVTPFCLATAILFALFVHRHAVRGGGDNPVIYGYAMAVMAAVDNLIYVSIHHAGNAISFYILGGIELICLIICFLYYQGIGNWGMVLCGAGLFVACTVLELEEAVRYFISVRYYDFTGYYFSQTLLDVLIALIGLAFVFAIDRKGE